MLGPPIQCCAQVGIGPQQPCPRKTQQSSTSLTGQLAVTIRQLPSCIVQPCHLPNKTGMVCQFDSNLPGFGILNLAGFKFYSFANFEGTSMSLRSHQVPCLGDAIDRPR